MSKNCDSRARRLYSVALRMARQSDGDYGPAAKRLQLASDLGCPDADYALATWYHFGQHFTKNLEKGNVFLKRAAKAGNRDACYNLAISYDNGLGMPKDRYRAFELYLEAALRGHLDAHKQVARCFWEGSGVKKNRVVADLWGAKHQELLETSIKNASLLGSRKNIVEKA